MLTINKEYRQNADRIWFRPARALYSKTNKVSIRARGDTPREHKSVALATLKRVAHLSFCCHVYFMNEIETLRAIEKHRRSCFGNLRWFAGVQLAPRIHPWDEQELPFATKAWIVVPADTPEEAQRAAHQLFAAGCGISPVHSTSPLAKHVFAYVVHTFSNN